MTGLPDSVQWKKVRERAEDVCCVYEKLDENTGDIDYNGCRVGKYTYGYETLLSHDDLLTKEIGRYCSINGAARVWGNHALKRITASTFLYGINSIPWFDYSDARESAIRSGLCSADNQFSDNETILIGNDA